MKISSRSLFFLLSLIIPFLAGASINVGIEKSEITPPVGTPSAGYTSRKGEGMQGSHDPLFAIALFIDNGEKKIVLCSVDHLGFTYDMVQEITKQIHLVEELTKCEIYIASSHTHSGGGSYLNIPIIGDSLAGKYSSEVTKFYIRKTVETIISASKNLIPAKIGIGYGKANKLSTYRGLFPKDIVPLSDVTILKITKLDDSPLAVLFNYPIHPTVLTSQNRLFSADFVGYSRDHLQSLLGPDVQPIYFNGAQGDINPIILKETDRFESCKELGESLAKTVTDIWHKTKTTDSLDIKTQKKNYSFKPEATPFGLSLPLEKYETEINVLVLNKVHAFITIPGELSTIYDNRLKELGSKLNYDHVSIFGLTNDAHGYIILPESWKYKTYESGLSFGGENYGEIIQSRAESLLQDNAPSLQ